MTPITKHACRGFSKVAGTNLRLFSPTLHLWLSAEPESSPSVDRQSFLQERIRSWDIKIGITERGFDEIGDIEEIEPFFENKKMHTHNNTSLSSLPSLLIKGDNFLKISWHGHRITQADELYHTVWETVEGNHIISSPLTGKLTEVATKSCWDQFGEDMWLARLSVTGPYMNELIKDKSWVDEEEYYNAVENFPPGAFADQ